MENLVSIIIPCYNAEKYIHYCIESAISQTYTPIEVIVVDDGSNDNSLEIIKEYSGKIQWVSCQNSGQSAARNKGLYLSKGKYIQFIDADDYIPPTKIEQQLEALKSSKADVVYSDWCYHHYKQDGRFDISKDVINQASEDMLYYIIAHNKILHGCCLFRREVIENISGFDESMRLAEDYHFSVRLALAGVKFNYQPGCYYFYRIVDNQVTASHSQGIEHPKSVEFCLDKITDLFMAKKLLDSNYAYAMANNYFLVCKHYAMLGDLTASKRVDEKCKGLDPNYQPGGNSKFEKIYRLCGWRITSLLMSFSYRCNTLQRFVLTWLRILKYQKGKS